MLNRTVLKNLINERNELLIKMNKIRDFKYNKTKDFLKLGAQMCQLIDIQYSIMNSYYETLTARIMLIREGE